MNSWENLLKRIKEDYKNSLKQKNFIKKEILNYIISQINYKKIELQKDVEDEDIIALIKKEIKTRQESLDYLEKVWNVQEWDKEKEKIKIISLYLPQMLSEDELKVIVEEKIKELNISDLKKQRGALIKSIMTEHKSVVDGKMLNDVIEKFNR